jgi:hypothetical protein
MGYTTPHTGREYLKAAALRVCHDYMLRAQYRSVEHKQDLLRETREIDFCAQLGWFFGPSAYLSAQGTSEEDLVVEGPTIRCEVKFLRPPARAWDVVEKDWNWLLGLTGANDEFLKNGFIIFWPGPELHPQKTCVTLPAETDGTYSKSRLAAMLPLIDIAGSTVTWKAEALIPRQSFLIMPGGKRIRCDIIGTPSHPVWACLYTRATPQEIEDLKLIQSIEAK